MALAIRLSAASVCLYSISVNKKTRLLVFCGAPDNRRLRQQSTSLRTSHSGSDELVRPGQSNDMSA